jgi:hypothetical protein
VAVGTVSGAPAPRDMGTIFERRWRSNGLSAFGASRPLGRNPAIVSFLYPKPALSLGGGNASSCPTLPLAAESGLVGWQVGRRRSPMLGGTNGVTPKGGSVISAAGRHLHGDRRSRFKDWEARR